MNLKKLFALTAAVLMATSAVAGNSFNLESWFSQQNLEENFTAKDAPSITAYAYVTFFNALNQRLNTGTTTQADQAILQAIQTHMLPVFQAWLEVSSAAVEDPQAQAELPQAIDNIHQTSKKITTLLVQEFDLKTIGKKFPNNTINAQSLDKQILDLAALDLSIAYLSETGDLSVEQTIMLQLLLQD